MFTYERKAQYHETDQMGIIHHSNYVKWMEEARIGFTDALGMGYSQIEKTGVISPVVKISVDYKRPVYFDDLIEIRVFLKSYSGIRLELGYKFFNKTREMLCAEASSTHCFMRDGRVISIKNDLPDLHEKLTREVAGE